MSRGWPGGCPRCLAAPKEPCRTRKTGKVTDTHAARMQLELCGALSPESQTVCFLPKKHEAYAHLGLIEANGGPVKVGWSE